MHAVEKLEKVPVAKAAIFLRSILPDRNELLLAENFQLLRHHGLTATQCLVELGHRSLPISQDFYNAQANRVGHGFQYIRCYVPFCSYHLVLPIYTVKHYDIFMY